MPDYLTEKCTTIIYITLKTVKSLKGYLKAGCKRYKNGSALMYHDLYCPFEIFEAVRDL